MAWLWSSWEEYEDFVVPILVKKNRRLKLESYYSWFEIEEKLLNSVGKTIINLQFLAELGFSGERSRSFRKARS